MATMARHSHTSRVIARKACIRVRVYTIYVRTAPHTRTLAYQESHIYYILCIGDYILYTQYTEYIYIDTNESAVTRRAYTTVVGKHGCQDTLDTKHLKCHLFNKQCDKPKPKIFCKAFNFFLFEQFGKIRIKFLNLNFFFIEKYFQLRKKEKIDRI